ncbi:MAG TPA: dTDP-4-dehydrorhamnose reductase [Accumulibacter sp.]|nr:dTDP-4-dehydrorhamnose reductase [Accumulibacter sp.]
MRILLTGKNGQLGFELTRTLAPLGDIFAVDVAECNLADEQSIRRLVHDLQPAVIVNAAAYTAVDKAESESAVARAINAEAPGILGSEAAKIGALLIHYSTDYIFDGNKPEPYRENDQPNPQNTYGSTKFAGELALASANPHHLILRTSWVVGVHGSNFAKTVLRLAAERDTLSIVADQIGAPTSASLLADVSAHLVRQYQREGSKGYPFGTYHVTAAGETSWYDYARFVLTRAIDSGKNIKVQPADIKPISTREYLAAAKRPANSRLDTTLFRETFGLLLPNWQLGLDHILQQVLHNKS